MMLLLAMVLLPGLADCCNQARRDSTWFTDRAPKDPAAFHTPTSGLQCWQCDGSFVKHERRSCLRMGERKETCGGGVQYCELRVRVGYRNYIHQAKGDMPAEQQVTWRGCARDWITSGDPYNTDPAYTSDPSYPPGMKCKATGVGRATQIAPGEEELHCLCKDSLCNEHTAILGDWGEFTYSHTIVLGCFAGLLILFIITCIICGIAH